MKVQSRDLAHASSVYPRLRCLQLLRCGRDHDEGGCLATPAIETTVSASYANSASLDCYDYLIFPVSHTMIHVTWSPWPNEALDMYESRFQLESDGTPTLRTALLLDQFTGLQICVGQEMETRLGFTTVEAIVFAMWTQNPLSQHWRFQLAQLEKKTLVTASCMSCFATCEVEC